MRELRRRAYALIFLLCFLDCTLTYLLLLKYSNPDLEFNPLLRLMIRHDYRYVFVYSIFESLYFSLAYSALKRVRTKAKIRARLEYAVFFLLLFAIVSNTVGLLAPASYK